MTSTTEPAWDNAATGVPDPAMPMTDKVAWLLLFSLALREKLPVTVWQKAAADTEAAFSCLGALHGGSYPTTVSTNVTTSNTIQSQMRYIIANYAEHGRFSAL